MAALDNTDIVALVGAGTMGAGIAQVAVVSGLTTDPQIAQSIFDTAENWGKLAVHTRSTPGFIVNRISRPFYAESLRLLQEGAGDAERA